MKALYSRKELKFESGEDARRPDHLAALWQIIDWKVIEQRFTS